MSGQDEPDEQAANAAREAAQKAVMMSDLGSTRREEIRTADYRNGDVNTRRIMRERDCVQTGTEASVRAAANKSALAKWSDIKQIGTSTEPDEINIADGQSHRVQLSRGMRAMRARQPYVPDEEDNGVKGILPVQAPTSRVRRPLQNEFPIPKRQRNLSTSGDHSIHNDNPPADPRSTCVPTAQAHQTGPPLAPLSSHFDRSDFPLDPAVDPGRRTYKYSSKNRNNNVYNRGDSTSPRPASPSLRSARGGGNRGGRLHLEQRRRLSVTPPLDQNQLVQSQMAQINRVIAKVSSRRRQVDAITPQPVPTPASVSLTPTQALPQDTASGTTASAWAIHNLATNPIAETVAKTNLIAEATAPVATAEVATLELPKQGAGHQTKGERAPEALAAKSKALPPDAVTTADVPNIMDLPTEEISKASVISPIKNAISAPSTLQVTNGITSTQKPATEPTRIAQQEIDESLKPLAQTIVSVPELYHFDSRRSKTSDTTDTRKQALASADSFWKWKNGNSRSQNPFEIPPRNSMDSPAVPAIPTVRHVVKPTPLIVPPPDMTASPLRVSRPATLKPPTNESQWTRPAQIVPEDAQAVTIATPPAAGRNSPTGTGVTELTERFTAFNLNPPLQDDSVEVIEMAGRQVLVSEVCATFGMTREAVIAMYRAQKAKKANGKFQNPFCK